MSLVRMIEGPVGIVIHEMQILRPAYPINDVIVHGALGVRALRMTVHSGRHLRKEVN